MQGDDFEYVDIDNMDVSYYIRCEHVARYLYAAQLFRKRRSSIVLDVACGSGYGSNILSRYVDTVIAIDKQPIIKKENLTTNTEFIQFDLENDFDGLLGLNSRVDAIACMETLEHLKEPEKFINSINKILRKGGILALSLPDGEYENVDSSGKLKNKYHLNAFTENDIEKMLSKYGFRIIRILYQSVSAQIYRNEARAIRDLNTDTSHATSLSPSLEDIEYYARLYAWPDSTKGASYSMVFICEKS